MNVIIYCRVSSDEQTLGASLDVQEERLRKYCNQMGYNIIDNIPYREDESAKTFEKRPVIQGIMSYIRKNKGKVNKLLFLRWEYKPVPFVIIKRINISQFSFKYFQIPLSLF